MSPSLRMIFYVFTVISLFALTSCRSEGLVVTLVVPNGSHGVFIVKKNKENGTEIPDDGQNVFVEIPKNGIIHVRNIDFLNRWHRTVVQYADKRSIRFCAVDAKGANPNETCCWELFSTEDSQYYYIGMPNEMDKTSHLSPSEALELLIHAADH